MTDATPAPAGAPPFALNPLAVTGVGLLRAVREGGWTTKTELAEAAGRLIANISRDITAYAKAGLITDDARALTDDGAAQLAAIERAERGDEPGLAAGDTDPRWPHQRSEILFLRHAQIVPDPANARRDWDSEEAREDLHALRQDILENGLLQNLVVRPTTSLTGEPTWQLVGGERRWRALGLAIGEDDWPRDRTIPCRLLTPEDATQVRIAALSENLQRRDLNPIEKAHGFDGLAQAGLSNQDIAERFGKTPEHVQQHRAFLTLNEADQTRLTLPKDDPRRLTVRQARELVAQRNKAAAPAPELGVSPVARLVAAEILHAVRTRAAYTWALLEVGPGAAADIYLTELVEAGQIVAAKIATYGDLIGRWTVELAHGFSFSVFPDMHGSDEARLGAALAAERDRLAQIINAPVQPEGEAAYTTAWLNPPFDITPEGQAVIDKRESDRAEQTRQQEEAERERQTLRATHARVAERARILFETARATTAAGGVDRDVVTEIAISSDAPLPWRMTAAGGVAAADGAAIFHPANHAAADRSSARLRLMVLAVNAAAGLETPEDEQPEPEADQADDDTESEAVDEEGE